MSKCFFCYSLNGITISINVIPAEQHFIGIHLFIVIGIPPILLFLCYICSTVSGQLLQSKF